MMKLAMRVTRLKRLERYSAPDEVITKEWEMIASACGELDLVKDLGLIRAFILVHLAERVYRDRLERIGALGNECPDCALWGKCGEPMPTDSWDFDLVVCDRFVRQIRPSRASDFEQDLVDLHGTYGIDKDRDLPILRDLVAKKSRASTNA